MRSLPCWTFEKTWHKLSDDTVDSVRCGHGGLQKVRTTGWQDLLSRAQARLDRAQQEQEWAPTQEQNNQRASQVAVTWRSYEKPRHGIDEIHPWRLS